MTTIPTTITEQQYKDAFFFIDEETAYHYLIYFDQDGNEEDLWIGREDHSLGNTIDDYKNGDSSITKVSEQWITDENGMPTTVSGYKMPSDSGYMDIDLSALAAGIIKWK